MACTSRSERVASISRHLLGLEGVSADDIRLLREIDSLDMPTGYEPAERHPRDPKNSGGLSLSDQSIGIVRYRVGIPSHESATDISFVEAFR